ncbi:MAG: NADH-quinone oxidoreductase subunit L [Spirochaetes bacterium]|nr:NADH-quinone oxidoreductase subunit L [Spirochaetota bacterium]
MIAHGYLILLFPLLAFAVNGLWLARRNGFAAGLFSILMSAASLAYAIPLALEWFAAVHGGDASAPVEAWRFTWLPLEGALKVDFSMILDPISVMMLLVIGTVALLVNVYSMGYMRHDPSRGRFFALLSLFAFSMLGLVIAGNVFQMYVFWELVGVSSYLLIGFWYEKPSAVAASKKAMIVTRFADSFFLLGIVLAAYAAGSMDFSVLNGSAIAAMSREVSLGGFHVNLLFLASLLMFLGGWGKSAMFPLHIWLPDAMEGPTPVSSIIHSATMVVAGVYLTARFFPMFAAAPGFLDLVRVVGIFTALFAAVIACTQKDIKRILAFSTLSQLGYMMFSLGAAATVLGGVNTAAYSASAFHIFTHAFFKCLLFLGAGALIHHVHANELDAMGGLWKKLPLTWISMLLACLAIAGIPPFSGFWSKDEIILAAWQSGHGLSAALALFTGFLTAFYMFRLYFLAFHGEPRGGHGEGHGRHEDPWMTVPIVILAVPTVLSGLLAKDFFHHFALPHQVLSESPVEHVAWLPATAATLGILGLFLAFVLYGRRGADAKAALSVEGRGGWYRLILNKFYIDELYLFVARRLLIGGFAGAVKWVDTNVVDAAVGATASGTLRSGALLRRLQNGNLAFYIGAFLFGILLLRILGRLPL